MAIRPPNTHTRTSHGLTIRAGTGRIVGAIHTWAPQESRGYQELWDMDANSTGHPADIVPQILRTRTIQIQRYDLFPQIMEEVFGTRELITLADQFRPFSVREIWKSPQQKLPSVPILPTDFGQVRKLSTDANAKLSALNRNIEETQAAGGFGGNFLAELFAPRRIYEYIGCWFSDLGRSLSASESRVVNVSATLIYQDKRRVL